jgi:amidase
VTTLRPTHTADTASATATTPLIWRTATELRDAIADGSLTAVEVMSAFYDRIEATNDAVNVIVYRLPRDEAIALAAEADAVRAAGGPTGPLHGLPIAIKDLVDVAGMPTSRGSRAFADRGPMPTDAPHVAKLRAAGALVIGKTNSPEFGVGTVTWNDVFGITRNPFDLTRHAGGSTGGVAAVAAGMLPFADGSDSGGSLRYPASFCNAVGLRTTPGLVPAAQGATSWEPHSVNGPVARNCRDVALLLTGMSGTDQLAPLSAGRATATELGVPHDADRPIRVAWSTDLGGLPISAEVRESHARTRSTLEAAGVEVVDVELDTEGLDETWQTIELFGWFALLGTDPIEHPDAYRDDFVRNVTEASGYPSGQIIAALDRRYRAYTEMAALLEDFDAFVVPGAPVVAPPAEVPWVAEVDGVEFDRYFLWQRLACRLVPSAHPVLGMAAGFSGHLPVGIQVVGRYGADDELLALGDRLEAILGVSGVHPELG